MTSQPIRHGDVVCIKATPLNILLAAYNATQATSTSNRCIASSDEECIPSSYGDKSVQFKPLPDFSNSSGDGHDYQLELSELDNDAASSSRSVALTSSRSSTFERPEYFKGYLKNFFDHLCMDWQDANRKDALKFVAGDWSKRGEPLCTGDAFHLVADNWVECAIPKADGNIQWGSAGSRVGQSRPPLTFTSDFLKPGTPLITNQIYWAQFAGDDPSQRWCTPRGQYFVQRGSAGKFPIVVEFERVYPDPSPSATSSPTTDLALTQVVDTSFEVPTSVYLTVDDSCGPYTPDLVNYIDQQGIKCVFFINGSYSQKYMEGLRAVCRSPNICVGIHTWSHLNMNTQLTIEQARKEIARTIALVEQAHRDVGKVWPQKPRLFRFPFTDGGQGYKAIQLQQILAEFGFHEHRAMQQCIGGKGRALSGFFLQDGLYKDKSEAEFMQHVKESFELFRTFPPQMWSPTLLLGTHDLVHEVALLKFLVARGVRFIDPVATF